MSDSREPNGVVFGPATADQLVALWDRSPALVYIKDAENRFLFANEALCELFGRSRTEIIGRTTHDFLPQAEADQHRANDAHVFDTGLVLEIEETNQESDGPHVYRTLKFPLLGPSGEVEAVAGVSTDITESKRVEADLVNSESTFRQMFDAMSEGFTLGEIVLDSSGRPSDYRFLEMNPVCERMLGLSAESARGHTAKEMLGGVGDVWLQAVGRVATTGVGERLEGYSPSIGRSLDASIFSPAPSQFAVVVADVTERLRAEGASVEREQRLRAVIDNAPFGAHLYRLEPDDRLVFTGFNLRAEEILGIDHAALIGMTLEEAFPGNAGTETPAQYKRVARDGTTWEVDQYAYDASGIAGVFQVFAFSFAPDEMSVFFRDITEEKRAAAQLEESREQLRATIDHAAAGIARMGLDGKWLDANECLCELLGYSVDELRALSFADVTFPDDSGQDVEALESMRHGDLDYFRTEKRYVAKDGHRVWVDVSAALARSGGGEPAYIVTVIQDMSDKKAAEAAQRESEERYRAIATNTPDHIFMQNADLIYTFAINPQLGLTTADMVGKTDADFLTPEDAEKMMVLKRRVLESGEPLPVQTSLKNAAGGIEYFDGAYMPTFAKDGTANGLIGYFRNVTQRKAAEDAVLAANARLEGLMKSITGAMGRVVEARDPYTEGHERGVAKLARVIAAEMGVSPSEVDWIEVAALVHDVGKLAVPAEILTRPGKLDEIEFGLIRQHSKAGYEILKDIEFGWPVAATVLQHHERMDGSGYPNGLAGEEISLAARIIAVADVVDAMASARPYRPALGLDAAVAEVRDNPDKFDGEVVAATLRLYERGGLVTSD